MSPILMNSGDYNIEAENACAKLLTMFNTEYIYDICENALSIREIPSIVTTPNIVNVLDFAFSDLKNQFPGDEENIREVRAQTHLEIIQRLCREYDAIFMDPGDEYHYILARNMYYFLVCGYVRSLIKFISSHIYKNRTELCNALITDAKRKHASASIYSKQAYKNDPKLAIIVSNMSQTIDYIMGMDVTLYEILQYIIMDKSIVEVICNSFKFNEDFFNFYRRTLSNPVTRPAIEGSIQMQLITHYSNELENIGGNI